jgi:hypothetical protein
LTHTERLLVRTIIPAGLRRERRVFECGHAVPEDVHFRATAALCPACAEIPHPITNRDAWARRKAGAR